MCTLIIFTNNDSLESIDSPFSFENNRVQGFQLNSLKVFIIKDDMSFKDQKEIINNINRIPDTNLYIHLHKTIQKNKLQDWKNDFSNANIVSASHSRTGFYGTILPKVVDETLVENDFSLFFVNMKLENGLDKLHKFWSTLDFNDQSKIDALTKERDTTLVPLV